MCEVFVQILKDENKCYREMYRQILHTNKIYNRSGKTKPRVPILVKFFVEKIGLDINKTNGAFYQACGNNNLEMVKYFLDHGVDANDRDQQGFLVALALGYVDIVKFLVDNQHIYYQFYNTYMQTACSSGNLEIVKYLEEKYYMNVVNQKYFKFACISNHIDLVKYMIEKGYDVKSEQSYSLRVASQYGYMELTKYFIEKGAKISDGNYDSIIKSSLSGQLQVVRYLFECEEIPQQAINKAFVYACFKGYFNVAEYLEDKGATCEEVNFSYFQLICDKKYYRIVELLYYMNYFDEHKEERYVNLIEENFGKKSLDQLKFSRRMRFLRLITAFSEY